MLLQDNPAICSERDDWDWYPLHFACYQNAPLSVIEKLVNIWPQGLNETVKMENERTGDIYDETALKLACYASAPDEVIVLLAKASHKLSYVNHKAGEVLMDISQDLNLIKKVFRNYQLYHGNGHWEWFHEKEHLFRPQKREQLVSPMCLLLVEA